MIGNLVLRRPVSGAVKRDFRTYIRRYTSPNEIFSFKMYFVALIRCIYSLVNQWKATLRNDVGFPTVNRRIYCRKFMTLSNQTPRCICKCIRIKIVRLIQAIGGCTYATVFSSRKWRKIKTRITTGWRKTVITL